MICLNLRSEAKAVSLVVDLWSEVVLEYSKLIDLVFDNERLLCVHAQTGEAGQRGGFIKQIEVADGELLVDGLVDLESGLLVLAHIVTLL